MHRITETTRNSLSCAVRGRDGAALPVVMAFMVVGSLLITATLGFMRTGLESGSTIEKRIEELYAADSGVEHALWKLKNALPSSFPDSYQLTGLNSMTVNLTIDSITELYGIDIINSGVHSDTMSVEATMTYNSSLDRYMYTVKITNSAGSTAKIDTILVKPPAAFSYVSGSASGITTVDPGVMGEPATGLALVWDFDTPRPSIPGSSWVQQQFYLAGPAGYTGGPGYVWVVVQRQDVGTVTNVDAFRITSRALRNTNVVTTVKAIILRDTTTGAVVVSSWEIE